MLADTFGNVVLWVIGGALVVVLLRWMHVGFFPKSPAQDAYLKAQALQQAILRDHFPTGPRSYEIAAKVDNHTLTILRSDARFQQARSLYLEAVMLDLPVDYGSNWKQKELNKGTAHNELMMIHRQCEEFDEALEHGQVAVSSLEKLADRLSEDPEVLTALSIAYFRFGEVNHVVGKFSAAGILYLKGLALDQKLGDAAGQKMYQALIKKLPS